MRNGKCPKCQSNKVGHLAQLRDWTNQDVPEKATAGVREREGARWYELRFSGEGSLEGYVCTSCGYLETYVKDPASVPYEELEGFSWVGAKDEGPYR